MWGVDLWGGFPWGAASIPLLSPAGLMLLAVSLVAMVVFGRRRERSPVHPALGLALLLVPLAAYAQTISVPHTFSNGTTADAAEVNANFSALVAEINDLHARVAALEAQIPQQNACGGTSTLANEPGATCGSCGLDVYVCSGTEATVCGGDTTANACGGCTTLANPPGGPCGACGDGIYVCSGTESTSCSGGSAPPCP